MKIQVWLENLTGWEHERIYLPVSNVNDILKPNCEYIITDCQILNPDELDSIHELNDFLNGCEENGIDEETLMILSATYLYHEVIEMVVDGTYTIVDFDGETAHWNCGRGGDFTNAHDKGMCVHEYGYYNPFDFEMTDDIHDWIDWESVWRNAETEDWREVCVNGKHYLVHK